MRETFPVLWQHGRDGNAEIRTLGCPRMVPWSVMAPHERQAQANHSQTLQRLAARGGLAPCEMVAVLEDRKWMAMSNTDAVKALLEHVASFSSGEPDIVVNGVRLTPAQACMVRVAVTTFEPGDLGGDAHGLEMQRLYTLRRNEVIEAMSSSAETPAPGR